MLIGSNTNFESDQLYFAGVIEMPNEINEWDILQTVRGVPRGSERNQMIISLIFIMQYCSVFSRSISVMLRTERFLRSSTRISSHLKMRDVW